eukprot:4911624-Alexandrium_andersonii.AAC.1
MEHCATRCVVSMPSCARTFAWWCSGELLACKSYACAMVQEVTHTRAAQAYGIKHLRSCVDMFLSGLTCVAVRAPLHSCGTATL